MDILTMPRKVKVRLGNLGEMVEKDNIEENEEENKLQIEGTEEIFKACVSNEDVKVSKIVPSLDNIHFRHSFYISFCWSRKMGQTYLVGWVRVV